MFEKDAKAQGIYIPLTTLQVLNNDGSVDETITMDWNSETSIMNTTTTKGGIPGVPPVAPEAFGKAQQEMWGTSFAPGGGRDSVGQGKKETKGEASAKSTKDGNATKDAQEKKEANDSSDLESKKAKTKTENEKPHFGKDFAHSLQGAFHMRKIF